MTEENENSPAEFSEFREDASFLTQCGFIGTKQLDEVNASRIFTSLKLIAPSLTISKLGLAYIALLKMEIKKATPMFQEIFELEPNNYLVKCFLGVCYMLTKDEFKKGEKMIMEAKEQTDDQTIKTLAVSFLDWAKKDLAKKSKLPL